MYISEGRPVATSKNRSEGGGRSKKNYKIESKHFTNFKITGAY